MLNNIKPYFILMRFHKPIGTFLLLWPTLWALWIANHGFPNLKILTIFICGCVLMRAAGCIMNDIADKDIDKHVVRTSYRPLTNNVIKLSHALLLFSLLSIAAFILLLFTNFFTILLSLAAMLLIIIYPLMKRYISCPQVILGIAFAWSIPMVCAATQNHIPSYIWLLFVATVCWVIAYDTQYALMDKRDDFKLGIKSTAILFGENYLVFISIFQLIFLGLLFILGRFLHVGIFYYLILVLITLLFLYQNILLRQSEQNGLKAFKMNNWVGLLLFLGILTST